MSNTKGFTGFLARLNAMKAKALAGTDQGKVVGVVGYTQNYAIFVHERLDVFHPVGQAKYLEEPFRGLAPKMTEKIAKYFSKGMNLSQAVTVVLLEVQRESQLLVPIDTGALRASAFVKMEVPNGPALSSPQEINPDAPG